VTDSISDNPFEDLPESLVEDMLNQCDILGDNLSASFKKLCEDKNKNRDKLKSQKLLKKDSDIIVTPLYPTTCGVDGSYAIEKLLSTDMVAVAGVAVEGLMPPVEKKYWEKPHHFSHVLATRHSESSTVVSRAIMMCMELTLVSKSPHDVVFMDGSLTTPYIFLNQALNQITEVPEELSSLLKEWLRPGLEAYKEILQSQRTDKTYVGVPKYTTRNEVTQGLNISGYEDRGFLSFILNAGEYVGPIEIQKPDSKWHIDRPPKELKGLINDVTSLLESLSVIYYRPYEHFPALRMEVPNAVANNKQRIAILLESIKLQCGVPGLMEPYPLYLADRMVKHLGTALPAIRKTTTQEMAFKWEDEIGNIYFAMHGYRTESGR
jgi:hypothetical protein